jgi:hypothetical protein
MKGFRGFKKKSGYTSGGLLKKTASSASTLAHCSGLRCAIAAFIPPDQHDEVFELCKERQSTVSLSKMRIGAYSLKVPEDTQKSASMAVRKANAVDWLDQNICVSIARKNKSFVVPQSLFASLHDPDVRDHLVSWVDYLFMCELKFDDKFGLHTFARGSFKKGSLVVKGFVEEDFKDTISPVGKGTLIGPIAFVNSGCSLHANVKFSNNWAAIATKNIKEGDQILASYGPLGGEESFTCPCCSKRVNGSRNK